jgi:hypothetical protein
LCNTLSIFYPHKLRDQVSDPYKTGKFIVCDHIATGMTRVVGIAAVLRCKKKMEKVPHCYFSWIVFPKTECEKHCLETKTIHRQITPLGSVSRGNAIQNELQ